MNAVITAVLLLVTVLSVISAAPVAQPELDTATSNDYGGYGGRQVIILDDSNGYGSYGHGNNYEGNYGGGYGSGYGHDSIVVHIPHSEPYYPEYNVPLYGRYTYPAHSPHYENSYSSYGHGY